MPKALERSSPSPLELEPTISRWRCTKKNDGILKRQKGESLAQLLSRLDLAIARAHTNDIFTHGINQPADSKRP
jgi:hypothetical protein